MKQKAISAFLKFREWFTHSKIFINRATSYITIINSGMILFLLLSRLQEYGLNIHISKWFFPIFLVSVIVMMIVGYLDYKLGFHREESRVVTERNPYFKEIIERLDKIEQKIKK
ncbi:hypothetical protein HQ545_06535 [Candidatus Woesearchaeota archaeon]|nr:hypothetical protein [Candidatus Woesearchaeota archaeon]